MDVIGFIDNHKIDCSTKNNQFKEAISLKQHCHDQDNWYHHLLKHYLIALHEVKPFPYRKHIKPTRDHRVTLDLPAGTTSDYDLFSGTDSDDTDSHMKTHNVCG